MANKIKLDNFKKLPYAQREAFNSLRTNLQFCGDDMKVIMFTSCTPNEGKSTVTMELARSLAESGTKTILIDADLRKSVLVGRHKIKGGKEINGLSHYLVGKKKLDEVIYETDIQNFDMIVAGPSVPNPTELFTKNYFIDMIKTLRENYDMVIIDCPPLGWVIDAAGIAPYCDGAVLVVQSDAVSYRYVQEVKKQLEMTQVKILGVVLNKVKMEGGSYYNHYYSGHYGKYYSRYGEYGEYGNQGNKEAVESAEKKEN